LGAEGIGHEARRRGAVISEAALLHARRILSPAGFRIVSGTIQCVVFAASNLASNRRRFLIAMTGTAMPILLIFLQMALLDGVRAEVTRLYNDFTFDIAIIPSTYEFLYSGGTFNAIRMEQARAAPGVAKTSVLNIAGGSWMDEKTKHISPVILIGVDDKRSFVANHAIRSGLSKLGASDDVLIDADSNQAIGSTTDGTKGILDGHRVTVRGQFRLGLFFYADGAVLVGNPYFPVLAKRNPDSASIGLVRVAAGSDVHLVRNELAKMLPSDVRVLTRSRFLSNEQAYFISNKPLGLIVAIGVVIAIVAGAVVLWQILSAEIIRRIGEFATLGAMGFSPAFIFGVGVCETVFMGLSAYLPALAIAMLMLGAVNMETHLPVQVSAWLATRVLFIVILMSALCSLSVSRRIRRAQPVSLF
jgi:putative ABC transport system permease protein